MRFYLLCKTAETSADFPMLGTTTTTTATTTKLNYLKEIREL